MEAIGFVMAIFGCGDVGRQCQPIRVEPMRYESADTCLAATADTLGRLSDQSFPTIEARCRPAVAALAEATPHTKRG